MKDYLFNRISIKFVFILITIFIGVNIMGNDLAISELSTEESDKVVDEEFTDKEIEDLLSNREELSDYHPDDNIEEESNTRAASSYEHLQGINLNDLIEWVTTSYMPENYPDIQTGYHSCHLIQNSCIELGVTDYCIFSCIEKYENTSSDFLDEDDYNEYVANLHLRDYIIQGLTVDKELFEQNIKCDSDNFFDFIDYMNSSSLERLNDIQFDCN